MAKHVKAAMAGAGILLTLVGACLSVTLILTGCTTGSKNDATWSLKFVQGIEITRHVSETKEESSWIHIDQDILSLWDNTEPKDDV